LKKSCSTGVDLADLRGTAATKFYLAELTFREIAERPGGKIPSNGSFDATLDGKRQSRSASADSMRPDGEHNLQNRM